MGQTKDNLPVKMDWVMEKTIHLGADLSLARMTLAASAISELHSHPNCNEVIHVLRGAVEQRQGQRWTRLEAGDTCLILAGQKHQTRNVGEERAVLILASSSGSRIYET